MDGYTLTFAPLLPWGLFAAMTAATAAVLGLGLRKRSSGIGFRTLAAAALLLAIARPTVTAEQRTELADVVLVVADASPSQQLGDRATATSSAVQAIQDELADDGGLEVRAVTVAGGGPGTNLFAAVRSAVADVPPDGVAGVVLVTDGQVHDVPEDASALGFDAPVHAVLTGAPGERDRRLVVDGAPRYGIVGEAVKFRVTLLDEAAVGQAEPVRITVPGGHVAERVLQVGTPTEFELPLERAGVVAVALEVAAIPDELTPDNNRVVIHVNAVRDRLRVMLVSGEPSMGLRHWRNLLQADPAVDLVHFTILRPPTKQDATPVQELSLIPFPARELFDANLDDFHLVIFDRYHLRGILPPQYLSNIAEYVVRGGALLDIAGPSYAGRFSLVNTPLREILPTLPAGEVIERPFVPELSEAGQNHPVTAGLTAGAADWGPWYRMVRGMPVKGESLMWGADGWPLLQLSRVGEGRVAQLLSDQSWVWTRPGPGGGPRAELLRRVVHWLMKEPDLEEHLLKATVSDRRIDVLYRSVDTPLREITAVAPSGASTTVPLGPAAAGTAIASFEANEPGLWTLQGGNLSATALVGAADALELTEMRADPGPLEAFVGATGGGVFWLVDHGGPPPFRPVMAGQTAAGDNWLGLRRHGRHTVTGLAQSPLLPWPLLLALAVGALFLAWHREAQ